MESATKSTRNIIDLSGLYQAISVKISQLKEKVSSYLSPSPEQVQAAMDRAVQNHQQANHIAKHQADLATQRMQNHWRMV